MEKERLPLSPVVLALTASLVGCTSSTDSAAPSTTPTASPTSEAALTGVRWMTALESSTDGQFATVPHGGQIVFSPTTVSVASALARDLVGQTLTRNFEVTGDELVLTPVDASEGWRVTSARVA